MAGLPNPCVRREKLVRPGYWLFGSLALMLLGPPTALSIACSSEMTSLCVCVSVCERVALFSTFHCCYSMLQSVFYIEPCHSQGLTSS